MAAIAVPARMISVINSDPKLSDHVDRNDVFSRRLTESFKIPVDLTDDGGPGRPVQARMKTPDQHVDLVHDDPGRRLELVQAQAPLPGGLASTA